MERNASINENKERYLYLDLLKIIALILMPCIHIFNLFSAMEFTGDAFPMEAVSEQMGFIYLIVPGVFMFCMGAGIVLSKKQAPEDLFRRGLKLLLFGFILNAVRGSIYIWLGFLSDKSCFYEFWYWLWGSDIMYFAGLYFLLFALFRKLKLGNIAIALISVAMLIVMHLLMPAEVENPTLVELLGNFVYIDEDSCFPLLSWCVFPTAGYLFTYYLGKAERKTRYVIGVSASAAGILAVTVITLLLTDRMQSRYYLWGEEGFMMDIPSAVIAISVATVYAGLVYLLSNPIKKGRITSLISGISARINSIYCIHWTIIMYLGLFLLLFSDCQINSAVTVYLIGVLVFAVSVLLSFVHKKLKDKRRQKNNSQK